MKDPVFISGLRKSGTSMVKNLLDMHPELFVHPPNELHFFSYSNHESSVKNKQESIAEPDELLQALGKDRFIQRMNDPSAGDYREAVDVGAFNEKIVARSPETFPDVYRDIYECMNGATSHVDADLDEVRPTSKTVLDTEFFPELRDWFPDLKFVYVLRNPYGHFVSARNSMRITNGAEGDSMSILDDPYPFIGSELRRMQLSYYLMEKYKRLYPDNFYLLVYDEILRNPEETLKDLAEFLDIEYHDNMTNPTICGEPWGGNSWYEDEFSGIDTSPLDHWMDDISPLEKRVITELFGDIIDNYGFDRLSTGTSLLRPLHIAERPHTYLANRVVVYWQMHGNV
jgi:hypothetical protein